MTITQIKIFLKVAQVKNFTLAGEELGMTQSAVSHAISCLENHLSKKLFFRYKKGIELTYEGNEVYPFFIEIQNQLNKVYETLYKENLPPQIIKIGVLPSISTTLLPKLLKSFSISYPQINFKVFEGSDFEIEHWLQEKTIDAGFITNNLDGIYSHNVISDEWFFICSISNKLSTCSSVNLNAIVNEAFIMSKGGCEPLIRNIAYEADTHINEKYSVSNTETIIEMVRENIGVAIMPKLSLVSKNLNRIKLISLNPSHFRQVKLGTIESIENDPLLQTIYNHLIQISSTFIM